MVKSLLLFPPLAAFFAQSSAQQTCDGSKQRQDCGFMGIDQGVCQARGCCWAPVNPNPDNLPFCFYKNSGPPAPTPAPGQPPYSETEIHTVLGYFLQNIDFQGSGAVIAAPSQTHPDCEQTADCGQLSHSRTLMLPHLSYSRHVLPTLTKLSQSLPCRLLPLGS